MGALLLRYVCRPQEELGQRYILPETSCLRQIPQISWRVASFSSTASPPARLWPEFPFAYRQKVAFVDGAGLWSCLDFGTFSSPPSLND